MSRVTVSLNGRDFTIGCEEGQEAYLRELAASLDKRVTDVSAQVGQIGDLRLLLMASLILVDDLRESDSRIEALEGQLQRLRHENHGAASLHAEARDHLTAQLSRLAARMESFAEAMEAGDLDAGDDEPLSADSDALAEADA
ncbi:cell division protein ZapA [uncultured Maricaulis sp.]|jgi:cell division protein ZapA|uniref:cell division protein ZapA n=1 Tax=uncultured Maricaulis sp. TaxID=174710 RepID=UPI0030D835D2